MDSPSADVFGVLPELRDVFPGCSSHEELYKFSIEEVSVGQHFTFLFFKDSGFGAPGIYIHFNIDILN